MRIASCRRAASPAGTMHAWSALLQPSCTLGGAQHIHTSCARHAAQIASLQRAGPVLLTAATVHVLHHDYHDALHS